MDRMNYIEKIRKFNRIYANLLGKIDQKIYHQPFPLTEARVINEINSRTGCTATEIREKLGIDRGYMSRIIQKFDDANIIYKEKSAVDKRQFLLYLSVHGEEVAKDLVAVSNREVGKMIQNLTEKKLSSLVNAMETIEHIFLKEHALQTEVIIRPFKPGDIGYVAHLHGRLYDKTYKFGPMFEYYVMKGLTEFMVNPEGGELWIAEVNGEIAGSIAITRFSETVAQLRWFVLDENYQGMGIGSKLMETALGFCAKQHYHHVFLWTVSILDAARHLYQKYHFKQTEEKSNEEWTGTKLMEERWDLQL